MQNSKNNLKKEKEKYAKEQLIKLGFLSKDNAEGYSKDEILLLVDYLIEIKGGEKELIPKEKKQEKKRENHFLYNDLLNGNYNIEELKKDILNKIKIKQKKKPNLKNFFQEDKKRLEIFRNIIRFNRSYPKVPEGKFQNSIYTYIKKYYQINDYARNSSSKLGKLIYKLKFDYTKITDKEIRKKILKEYCNFFYTRLHLEGMSQVIIYDILYESFNKEIRDIRYTKMYNFLNNYYISIKNLSKISILKRSKNIFLDFFLFLLYCEEINDWKESMRIDEEISMVSYFDKIKIIGKDIQFKYGIEKLISNPPKFKERTFISNFDEFPKLFDLMDQNGLIEIEKLKIFKEKKITKTEENEIIYEKKKIKNNYDKIKEVMLEFIKGYPSINEKNLQVLKASINAVENYKTKIKPFRKKLMTCVLDSEIRNSKIIKKYLRTLITKGIYHEKGISEEFERTNSLEKIILNIFIELVKNKSDKYFLDFIKSFYQTMDDIYKDIPVYNFFTENLYNKMEY